MKIERLDKPYRKDNKTYTHSVTAYSNASPRTIHVDERMAWFFEQAISYGKLVERGDIRRLLEDHFWNKSE